MHMPLVGHPALFTNYKLSSRILNPLVKRLEADDHYGAFLSNLNVWLLEAIILGEILALEIHNYGHNLPHSHVMKKHSTTKLRPLFLVSNNE